MRSRFYQSLMQRGSEERMVLALGAAVSISIGVAEYREDPLPEEWMKSADNALLEAKRKGRNQVLSRQPAGTSSTKLSAQSLNF
jgi:PleD family two-component response regulator